MGCGCNGSKDTVYRVSFPNGGGSRDYKTAAEAQREAQKAGGTVRAVQK